MSLSLQSANAVMSKFGAQLKPFGVVADETTPWEEKSVAVRFANKRQKSQRNKHWRKRKRKRIAEMFAKVVTPSIRTSPLSLLLAKLGT